MLELYHNALRIDSVSCDKLTKRGLWRAWIVRFGQTNPSLRL